MESPVTGRGPMPAERFARYNRSDLDGQFVLSRDRTLVPEGWATHERAGWILAAHASLPVHVVRARDGADLGWLPGWPIDTHGVWLNGDVVLDVASDAPFAAIESALYQLGGKFLAVLLTPHGSRVYLDAAGLLSCVYSPAHSLLAATSSLVPYTQGCDDDRSLLELTGLMSGARTANDLSFAFAFGMTSRRGVERLLPNHTLDLATWVVHRHWPLSPLDADADPRAVVEQVGERVARHIRAIASQAPVRLPLTAGHDSRALLACARPMLEQIELFTVAFPDGGARMDVAMASRLARKHGLAHRTLVCDSAGAPDLDEWLWRTGACVGGARGWQALRAYASLPDRRPEVSGALGEAARAAYWKDLRAEEGMPDARKVVRALVLPETPEIMQRASMWLQSLPATRTMHVVDLVYLEQRAGSWTGVVPYGHKRALPFRFAPFVHRDTITAMLRLPDAYKLEKRFPRDLIASRWPELLSEPFNRYPGIQHYTRGARKRLWRLRRALSR